MFGHLQNQQVQQKSLWIGDIDPWMDENYLTQLFAPISPLVSVKLIRDKITGQNLGYGFLEFQNHQSAAQILNNYNGCLLPNASKAFKMNWGQHNKQLNMQQVQQEVSVYVCDLDVMTTDKELLYYFQQRYPSATGVKLIQDPSTGQNKGYGFVKFVNADEAQRSIKEMNGQIFRGRMLKVSNSFIKNPQQMNQVQMQGYNMHSMLAGQQNNQFQFQYGMQQMGNQHLPQNQLMNLQGVNPQMQINPIQNQFIQQPQQIFGLNQLQTHNPIMQIQDLNSLNFQNQIQFPNNLNLPISPKIGNLSQYEIPKLQKNNTFQVPNPLNTQPNLLQNLQNKPIQNQLRKDSNPETKFIFNNRVQVVAIQNKDEIPEEWSFNLNTDLQKQLFQIEKTTLQQNIDFVWKQDIYQNFLQDINYTRI